LESPREGLQTPKILWTKVQKQKKFGRFCRSSDIPFSRSLVQSLWNSWGKTDWRL